MSLPKTSIDAVYAQLPQRGFVLIDYWTDGNGEDCKAIKGRERVLYAERDHRDGFWVVQKYRAFDDPSVGIFGEEEPGQTLFAGPTLRLALGDFMAHEARCEAEDVCVRIAEAAEAAEGRR